MELDMWLDADEPPPVIRFKDGSCYPANRVEVALFAQLHAAQAEVERLTAENEALRREVEDVRSLDAWAFARRNKKAVVSIRYYYGEACFVWEVLLQQHGEKSLRFEGQTSAHDSDPQSARRAAVEFLKKESGK